MMHDLARDARHACAAAAVREWLLRAANGRATAYELSKYDAYLAQCPAKQSAPALRLPWHPRVGCHDVHVTCACTHMCMHVYMHMHMHMFMCMCMHMYGATLHEP